MTNLGREIEILKNRVARMERAPRLSSAAIDDTSLEVRDGAGSLRALVGQQADGTTAVNVVNGPPPPMPSPPVVASVLGGVTVSWNGTFDAGAALPLDFSRIEVHADTLPGFTASTATLRATIETPQGATVVVPTSSPVYVRLLARNTSGTASNVTAQVGPTGPAPVVADDIINGIVTELKIANDAVTAAKIATSAVGTTEISDDAVTTAKIVAGAILAGQIAAGAVVTDKLAADAVTAGKIAALAVTTGKLDANAVTTAKLAAGSVDATALKADAITGKTITGGTVTGATLQTDTTGKRVKVIPSNSIGIPAVQLYSGESTETAPGELVASVRTSPHARPFAALWAPTVAAADTSATLQLVSGGGTSNDQGEFELSTGDGSGGVTRLYGYASDGSANAGQITASIYEPVAADTADLTFTADTLDWTDINGKGFTSTSESGSTPGLYVTGVVQATDTEWTAYTPTVAGHGTATFTTRTGWYTKLGKVVFWNVYLVVNAAGSGTSTVTITSPSTPDRTTRQLVAMSAESVKVAGLFAAGHITLLTTGTGAVWDRMSTQDNGAADRVTVIQGQHLLTGAVITIQGMYREA